MLSEAEQTLAIVRQYALRCVLLQKRSKEPATLGTGGHVVARDEEHLRQWLAEGNNVGIYAGNIAILDFDRTDILTEMFVKLGPIDATVATARGKHFYVQAVENLPTRIIWNDAKAGEVLRLPTQYVVAPPSIHPSGAQYTWLDDTIPQLPDRWKEYLLNESLPDVPEWAKKYIGEGIPEPDQWDGPTFDEMLLKAQRQPGFRSRSYGVKFQCPACKKDGHDKHRDNAILFNDGHFTCVYPGHTKDIAKVLGAFIEWSESARSSVPIANEDLEALRAPINE